MKLIVTFLVTFLAGPMIFWALAGRRQSTQGYFRLLWVVLIALIVAAFLLNSRLSGLAEPALGGLGVVMLMWLAWIVVLALVVLAVRGHGLAARTNRWVTALGAMATTLPWFGLYTAQMVAD